VDWLIAIKGLESFYFYFFETNENVSRVGNIIPPIKG